jgi:hypothetical protein
MIVSLDVKIEEYCTTISDDDRYEHQGYLDAEKARYEAIDRLIDTTAQSWTGMRVKADALRRAGRAKRLIVVPRIGHHSGNRRVSQ